MEHRRGSRLEIEEEAIGVTRTPLLKIGMSVSVLSVLEALGSRHLIASLFTVAAPRGLRLLDPGQHHQE